MAKTGPGVYTDFKIYEEQFYGAYNDVLSQNTNAFNAASRGAIQLVRSEHAGNFLKEAYFAQISSILTRRDITSTSAVTDDELKSDEVISPKLARRFQVANTYDSFKKAGISPEEFAAHVGEQVAKNKMTDWLNTGLLCARTAIAKTAASFYNKGSVSTNTLRYTYLTQGLQLFGDASDQIIAWVMHSKSFTDLLETNISALTNVTAPALVFEGIAGTLNRPVVITDSSSLINTDGVTSGTDSYYTLGLTAAGLGIVESESDLVIFDNVTGNENLIFRAQGENAYDVSVKGISYTSATVNPNDATLGTAGNWTLKRASVKSAAGVVIEHA